MNNSTLLILSVVAVILVTGIDCKKGSRETTKEFPFFFPCLQFAENESFDKSDFLELLTDRLGEDKANRFLANYFYYGHQHHHSKASGSIEYYDDIDLPCLDLSGVTNFTKADFIELFNEQLKSETFDAFVAGLFHHVHRMRDNSSKSKSSESNSREESYSDKFTFELPCFNLSRFENLTKADFVDLVRTQLTYDNIREILKILRDYQGQSQQGSGSKMSKEDDDMFHPLLTVPFPCFSFFNSTETFSKADLYVVLLEELGADFFEELIAHFLHDGHRLHEKFQFPCFTFNNTLGSSGTEKFSKPDFYRLMVEELGVENFEQFMTHFWHRHHHHGKKDKSGSKGSSKEDYDHHDWESGNRVFFPLDCFDFTQFENLTKADFEELVRDQISRRNFEAFMSGLLFHSHKQRSSESMEENYNDYPYPFPCFNVTFANSTKVDFADLISNQIDADKLVEFLETVRHVHVPNDKSKSKSVEQGDVEAEKFPFSFPCFHLNEDEDFNREDFIMLLEERFSRFVEVPTTTRIIATKKCKGKKCKGKGKK